MEILNKTNLEISAKELASKEFELLELELLKKKEESIKQYNELLEKNDRDSYAHYLLAEAYLSEKNVQYAIMEYRQVLKIGKFDHNVREINVRKKLAAIYKERNALEEAKKEYLILTQIDPVNYENYYALGVIYFDAGMYDKASSYLKKSISINKKHDQSYFYLGQTMYRLGKFKDAKQLLADAVKIDNSNYKAHYFLGLVLRQMDDLEWAIKEFEIAERSDELKVRSYLAKGTCFLQREQYPRAIIEFEKGLKYAKSGSDSELNLRYYLAGAQERMRDLGSAISNWESIVKVKKNFKDVEEKLKSYSDFRQDDSIKDFLTAGLAQFEHICRKMVEGIGYTINDIEIHEDDVEIVALEPEGKYRNLRRNNWIIKILRSTDSITDILLRKLYATMKARKATRIVVISTGTYSKTAIEFANTRPIDLLGTTELLSFLKKSQ